MSPDRMTMERAVSYPTQKGMLSPSKRAGGSPPSSQKGGVVIIAALMLLALLSAATFTLSGSVVKELATTGNVYQASRAESAADAGLDWFVAWANEGLAPGSVVGADRPRARVVVDRVKQMQANFDLETNTWVTWTTTLGTKDGFYLGDGGGSGSQALGQAFELSLVYLGQDNAGPAPNGLNTPQAGKNHRWEVQSSGQAHVPFGAGANDLWRFWAVRAGRVEIKE